MLSEGTGGRGVAELAARIARLPARAAALPGLEHRGRLIDADVMLGADIDVPAAVGASADSEWLLRIRAGSVADVRRGPFVMPRCDVALRASLAEWTAFVQDVPPPGHHDLMALIKRRAMRLDGDAGLVMGNLFYFKALLCLLRENPQPLQTAPLPVVSIAGGASHLDSARVERGASGAAGAANAGGSV